MPHTHATIICLPRTFLSQDDATCVQTLVHEKIHVWQRTQPWTCAAYVAVAGYLRACRRDALGPDVRRRTRSNPDIDDFVYRRPPGGATVFLLAERPTSLSDGSVTSLDGGASCDRYEHPYEAMAHTLSESLVQQD